MIMEEVKEVQETIEFKQDTIYIERATLILTTRENRLSMNILRTNFREHNISWIKIVELHTYLIKSKNQLMTYYLIWH